MNNPVLLYLSLSLSGTILGLLLLLIKPLVRHRVSKTWQYYIFLIVIARMLIPFSPATNLTGSLFQMIKNRSAQEYALPGTLNDKPTDTMAQADSNPAAMPDQHSSTDTNDSPAAPGHPPNGSTGIIGSALLRLPDYVWLIWLVTALTLLIRKITVYHSFINFMKVGCRDITDPRLLLNYQRVCASLNIRRPPALYRNEIAAAPMLVGIFRPYIVLPDMELSDQDAEYTLRHELTHCKRGDIYYKWLVQFTACLHWFNPFIYILSNEINRSCELSCDESVIRQIDETEKYNYGDMLLATIKPDKGYSSAIISVTLNENTRLIKERLEAIMNYKSKSLKTGVVSALLTILILTGAAYTGAYAAGAESTQYPDYFWTNLHTLPHTTKFDYIYSASKLQISTFSLEADKTYQVTAAWKEGSGTLGIDVVNRAGDRIPHTLTNGRALNITVPQTGLYFLESPKDRETGNMREFSITVERVDTEADQQAAKQLSAGQTPAPQAADSPAGAGNHNPIDSSVAPAAVIDCKVEYDDTPYKWPYLSQTVKNTSDQVITGYDITILAFDKTGAPLELYWDARNLDKSGGHGNIGFGGNGLDYGEVVGIYPYSPKSYDTTLVMTDTDIRPDETYSTGGWNLFDGWWDQPDGIHKARTLLAGLKQVTFEDGSTWENPEYNTWLSTYRAKSLEP